MNRVSGMIALVTLVGMGGVALAEETTSDSYRSFTFKRVKAPTAQTARRITVQIDPEEQAAWMALPPDRPEPILQGLAPIGPGAAGPGTGGGFEWYWSRVSPALAEGSPGRIQDAVAVLGEAPAGQDVPVPRLQSLQAIADAHGRDILMATVGTRVSPALVLAVINTESGGRRDAVSHAGAQGLMQLIPATADRFGVADSMDPVQNIRGGVAYLDWLMKEFGNDPLLTLAAYNAGENAVKKNGGVPPFAETRAYVPKVLAAWSVARGLCLTPPMLASDGCVFPMREARNGG